jgi:O-antigen/teichoic acid export membrane protein
VIALRDPARRRRLLPSPIVTSVTDQAVSSMGNVTLTVLVASRTTTESFGAFSVVLGVYILVLTVEQALVGEPLLASSEHTDEAADANHASAAALQLGVLSLIALAIVSQFLPAPLGPGLLTLGWMLPGLLLQDSLRFVAFSRRRAAISLVNDSIWVMVQLACTVLIFRFTDAHVSQLVLAWAIGSFLAALFTLLVLKVNPLGLLSLAWYRQTSQLGLRYVGENLSAMGTFQVITMAAGAILGLPAAGALRLGHVVFGPVHVAYSGVKAYLTPKFVSELEAGRPVRRMAVSATAAFSGFATVAFIILVLTPKSLGSHLLGGTWALAHSILPMIYLQKLAECVGLGPLVTLRAQRRAKETLAVRVRGVAVAIALAFALMPTIGLPGAAAALALSSSIVTFKWWRLTSTGHLP